jgi:nitroreductase
MLIADLIRSRRTIGAFLDEPIAPEMIIDWLNAAVWTPNHHMTEPWRFIILVGEATSQYADIRRHMAIEKSKSNDAQERQQAGDGTYAKFAAIPAYLIVVQKLAPDEETRDEDFAACAALIQNFMLLAWGDGVGTAWKTFKNDPRLRALFELKDDEKVVGIVHIGYPAENPVSRRSSLEARVIIKR